MTKHELEQLFDSMLEESLVSVIHDLRSRGLLDHVEGECSRCGSTLLPGEMVDAAEVTGGLCSWCWHQWQRIQSA